VVSEEYEAVREAVRALAEKEIAPYARRLMSWSGSRKRPRGR
jgi:hypothetical protein